MPERPLRRRLSKKNMTRRGVPSMFHEFTIEDFKDYNNESLKKVKDLVRNYVNNMHEVFESNLGLFLFGSNGVGKSLLASIIVKEAYRHRYTSKRCTFKEYMQEYTRMWKIKDAQEYTDAETEFYRKYKAVEFLALEEIGKEMENDLSPNVLEDLLRYREDNGLPTVICTNLSPEKIVNRYGASIGDLVKGNFTPVKIVGKSKREDYYSDRNDVILKGD